jgi:hypothetical protein
MVAKQARQLTRFIALARSVPAALPVFAKPVERQGARIDFKLQVRNYV